MTELVQLSSSYPATLRDWELMLTSALLRADGGNADAIRCFEITPETLAEFCGLGPEHAEGAERAFRAALRAEPHLSWCLQHGTYLTPRAEVPNCIAILALSLLVDSLIDGDSEGTGAYRTKLAQWLEMDRSFMVLRGIATMWKELVVWLDGRVDAGAPFRRLVLPKIPASWTHIGYTRFLSFPTKRDLRFLRKQIERSPGSACDPVALVRLLDPVIRTSPVSFGLKGAFEDFRTALRSGRASVDHRFWRFVARARAMAGQKEPSLVDFRMEFDEDGDRHYRLGASSDSRAARPPDIGEATATALLLESPNLGPSVRRGVLFFRSSGLASWTALGEPPSGAGPFHLAIANHHRDVVSEPLAHFQRSGTWYVTVEPIGAATIFHILKRLGIQDASESVQTIGLVEGVHVGKGWLGQPRFLPYLEGATGAVDIRPEPGSPSSGLSWTGGGLKADVPIEGEFVITDRVAGWSRRATFVALAEVHARMDGANYALPMLEEWGSGLSKSPVQVALVDPGWDDKGYVFQDVLEAFYASARSGVSEGEAVALIERAAGRRSWELLRTLQESTFLDARLRLRWRGRVFTLVQPTLSRGYSGGVAIATVSGAVPGRLEADFRRTVELQGGRPFRRVREASLAPPLLGAIDVDAASVAEALGWTISIDASAPDGWVSERLCETQVVGENYQVASAWDWSIGRFRAGAQAAGPVSLVRLVHPSGRDHDLYRVIGNRQRTFTSRHAAIVDLYSQASSPMFRYQGGLIRRITAEGTLPIEIARVLRLRMQMNGGAAVTGWEYGVAPDEAHWLAKLLPGLIDGVTPAKTTAEAMMHRRGRGVRRPLWIDGGIAV